MYEPPINPGQVLDKDSEYGKWWTGQPALFKLSDTLLLQIPPMYQKFWIQRDKVTRAPADLDKIPKGGLIGFEFFMPDFSGYTPYNYESEFHEDRVQVVYVEHVGMGAEQPGASGYFPPNMFQRITTGVGSINQERYEERFGLRCYEKRPNDMDNQVCYGVRDATVGEFILLDITVPPYNISTRYPHMQARYFSPRYGGMNIVWRSHMKHFERWRDIDVQIWKFIDAWNIAKPVLQPKQ